MTRKLSTKIVAACMTAAALFLGFGVGYTTQAQEHRGNTDRPIQTRNDEIGDLYLRELIAYQDAGCPTPGQYERGLYAAFAAKAREHGFDQPYFHPMTPDLCALTESPVIPAVPPSPATVPPTTSA